MLWCYSRQPSPRIFNEPKEAVCEFLNSLHLSSRDGIRRYQVHPDPQGSGARQNESGCRMLSHAPRRDQGNLRQRLLQCFDISVPAYLGTGKHLHEVRAQLPCREHFRRSERTRNQREALRGCEFRNGIVEHRRCQETRPSIEGTSGRFRIQYRARTHDHSFMGADEVRDQVNRFRSLHANLQYGDAAAGQRIGGKTGVFPGRDPHCRDNANFLDARADFFFIQGSYTSLSISGSGSRSPSRANQE